MDTRGLMIGIAIGDAFGAGVEFQDRDWIKNNVSFKEFVNARDSILVSDEKRIVFTENYSAWSYTDDTEMTIGLINALISKERFTRELLISKWKDEYELGVKTNGFGRNGHGSMRWYYSGEKTIEEVREFQKNRTNPGNAPAMRAVPLGLIDESLINLYARINAEATHPNRNAIISSQIIARAAHFVIIKNGNSNDIIDYCLETIEMNNAYIGHLRKIDGIQTNDPLTENDYVKLCGEQPIKPPYFLPGINGVPSDSMFTAGCVLYLLKISKTPFDALKNAIWFGGDVDSLASITTGILAGKWGISSIPNFMVENVEGKNYLEKKAKELQTFLLGHTDF